MSLNEGADRTWPIPTQPWVLAMRWHDLLFMHWPVKGEAIRRHIPAALTIDTFDGAAWIGVVPFRMSGVRPRLVPPLPALSAFPELNVRTYVIGAGRPGVWFFSLDAGNRLAVAAARLWYFLPYFHAAMSTARVGDTVSYESRRLGAGTEPPAFRGSYGPTGPVNLATPGSVEHWLTERYCLYASRPTGRVMRAEVHHPQWPLQPAGAEIEVNTMTRPIGVRLPDTRPLLHFSERLDVVVWQPRRIDPQRHQR